MQKADFLLEIGTEEIPAGYVERAVNELALKVAKFFVDQGVEVDGNVEAFATPRRLAVRVSDVALEQATRTETRLGPAVKAAFDADGKPTKAAEGFARSVNAAVDELEQIDTDKGPRLGCSVTTGGAATRDLLLAGGVLIDLLALGFPKTMRWIPGHDLRFARPIRSLVCLLGEEVVPMQLAHLTAGRSSQGHRTLSPGSVEIQAPASYEADLRAANVEVVAARRREQIERGARELAEQAGGRVHEAPDLLEELIYLSEHPTPVLGSFAAELVDILPPEVIITAMRSHQRYFSVEDASGRLLPRFITFRDGGDRGLANVVEGNERVLRARLDDARFYWDEDRSLDSDAKLERLDRIVWLEGYGSIGDKCRRIAALAKGLAAELAPGVDLAQLERAALLCKSDLATEMIRDGKEFTKLQGVIGRYYALEAGESGPVAEAIAEHLYPRQAADRLPKDELSTLVALADRLDSIAGCVLAGFAPTGSQDPYALRRQSLAVVRILVERGWRLDLLEWVRRAVADFGAEPPSEERTVDRIAELFGGRLETQLDELPAEIVRAVLSVSPLDPIENIRAARALAALRDEESFGMLLEGAKRCRNILVKEDRLDEESLEPQPRAHRIQAIAAERWQRWQAHVTKGDAMAFQTDAFAEDAERSLHDEVVTRVPVLAQAIRTADHGAVYTGLAELGPTISRYFDEVLVNAPDEGVRRNRLSFLEEIHYLFTKFADLSRIPSV